MKTPILGSSYVVRSVNAACNRMVNLFPEIIPEAGKEPGFLNRCPGLRFLKTVGDGPIRGLWQFGGNGYVVSGGFLYKMASDYTVTLLGPIYTDNLVSMSDNGTQLFIASNPNGAIYNDVTGVFQQITDPDFPGAVTVGYLDGYFVFNEPDSPNVWVTTRGDGTAIEPLTFESIIGSTGNLLALKIDHSEAWLFSDNSIQVWYDAQLIDFPLQPISGAYNEIGLAAVYSIAKMDNSIFWVGADDRGTGIIYRTSGYGAQRISTHAVEWQIQSYGDISDAIGYTYQQDGHSFYVVTFPTGDATWVYDIATNSWHERAGFIDGEFTRHRSNCQMTFNGQIVVGDFENGNLYTFDLDTYADNGQIQKWLRSWRALAPGKNDLTREAHHSLQLDCESGVGLNDGQGSDPQVMLRWSDDGGHTWSQEFWKAMGKIGQYFTRVIWRRLGMTNKLRDRVYEVSGTDPVKIAIVGAQLSATPTDRTYAQQWG
jgi:hypothetical protein